MVRVRPLAAMLVVVVVAVAGAGACAGAGSSPPGREAHADVVRAPASSSDALVASTAVNRFAFALLGRDLGVTNGNVAMSPWSIAASLAMVRAGAQGATRTQIDSLLSGVPDQAMNSLGQQLASRNGTFTGKTVQINQADRAFVQNGLAVAAGFLDNLARNYGAGVGLVDYEHATEAARAQINAWVAAQTDHKIPDLIASNVLDAMTRLVLVNAVYLKADWQTVFAKQDTSNGEFHAPEGDVTVPFMHGEVLRTASGDGWQGVDLDYAGAKLVMTIVVPHAGRFDDVVGQLPAVLAAMQSAPTTLVALALPKFTIDQAMSLRRQLSELGMPTAFTDQADFAGITGDTPLKLQDVVHQADVRVDEKGTVAAAATGSIFEATAAPLASLDVDRPFLFVLRDRPTGAVLFAGQVTNPSAPQ